MTPQRLRSFLFLAGAGVAVVFLISVWRERKPTTTVEQAVAREQTRAAEGVAAKAETVYVETKAAAVAARVPVRALRDALLRDTVIVDRWNERGSVLREYVARVDTLIAKDSIALAAADVALATERDVTASVRAELALALRPKRDPRLRVTLAGLYDPIAMVPVGSASASVRVISGWALIVRGDYRVAPLEPTGKARLYGGVQVTF